MRRDSWRQQLAGRQPAPGRPQAAPHAPPPPSPTSPASSDTFSPSLRARSSAGRSSSHCRGRRQVPRVGEGSCNPASARLAPAPLTIHTASQPRSHVASHAASQPSSIQPLPLCPWSSPLPHPHPHLALRGVAREVHPHHAPLPQRRRQAHSLHRLAHAPLPVDGQQQADVDVCGGGKEEGCGVVCVGTKAHKAGTHNVFCAHLRYCVLHLFAARVDNARAGGIRGAPCAEPGPVPHAATTGLAAAVAPPHPPLPRGFLLAR